MVIIIKNPELRLLTKELVTKKTPSILRTQPYAPASWSLYPDATSGREGLNFKPI